MLKTSVKVSGMLKENNKNAFKLPLSPVDFIQKGQANCRAGYVFQTLLPLPELLVLVLYCATPQELEYATSYMCPSYQLFNVAHFTLAFLTY